MKILNLRGANFLAQSHIGHKWCSCDLAKDVLALIPYAFGPDHAILSPACQGMNLSQVGTADNDCKKCAIEFGCNGLIFILMALRV